MQNLETSIADRISTLERRYRRMVACLAIVPCLAFFMGVAANEMLRAKAVIAEKLVVVDSEGKTKAAIYTNEQTGDPTIELYNPDGSLLLNLGRSKDNDIGFIQFFDKSGQFKGGAGGNALK